ncbi:MAG: phosphoenolpyruvate--protein phosphotransferase [Myxococcaceae bacterium]|jgi:phosphotransferase system enzyme I (PtsI)|nr:phosphoenolpyruvate--protein phosphotransferase [Myxococcaceae bacterium]
MRRSQLGQTAFTKQSLAHGWAAATVGPPAAPATTTASHPGVPSGYGARRVTVTVQFQGIGASPGVAVGQAFVLDAKKLRTPKVRLEASEVDGEVLRLRTAISLSDRQLEELKERLSTGAENEHGLILEAHRMMLHDPVFLVEVTRLIKEDTINAEWAVRRVCRRLRHQFDNLEDEYFRERKSDIEFVADRIVRNLMGEVVDQELEVPVGAIVVAHDISPADAAMLVKTGKVGAFVTDLGGQTSHTAIVARARDVPAVVGLGKAAEAIRAGDTLAVDGRRGLVLVNPPEEQLALFRETMRRQLAIEALALKTAELPSVTVDGARVRLNGNIEFADEIPSLLAHGAEGIGLYRTEFLFLDRPAAPTEEEHYQAYKAVLEAMGERPVTIRTLDLGADKVPGKAREKEINPALGLRAIRYCLQHREVFRAQLRALLRASVHGNLKVMFPMVSGVSELREARSELEACRSELSRQGVPLGRRFPVGIMVETPSAAWIADRLAQEADFFSIGTNDLIQYSLAIDRQNRDVAYLYRPMHLSILRMVQHIVGAAKGAGIPVAMCGEMAGDASMTLVLLALGLDEFSMTSGQIPTVKRIIRSVALADAKALLEKALQFTTAEEIERFVKAEMDRRFATLE